MPDEVQQLPGWAKGLFAPSRYKVAYGGRGGGKSWTFARALLIQAATRRLRIMCAREVQRSIRESVYQLLCDQIDALGLSKAYEIRASEIRCPSTGSRFFFAGLRQLNADQLKSYEDIDICWVEEAHTVSARSWDILLPTIRAEGSEIWITFNPDSESDPVWRRFVQAAPPDAWVVRVNYDANPWFPETLERERAYWAEHYPETYDNVWLGVPRAAVRGAFYAREIQAAIEEDRITTVPVLSQEVHTAWDLGMGDMTAIWFFQVAGQEIHFIDYYEAAGEGLEHYARVLQSKRYVYGTHFAPHDIRVREMGTGISRLKRAQQLGIRFRVLPTNRMKIEDGIEIVRSQFPRIWIDAKRCARGIEALKHYHAEVSEADGGIVINRPRHNWASHGADAFRYACLGVAKYIGSRRMTPDEIRELYESYAPPRIGELTYAY